MLPRYRNFRLDHHHTRAMVCASCEQPLRTRLTGEALRFGLILTT